MGLESVFTSVIQSKPFGAIYDNAGKISGGIYAAQDFIFTGSAPFIYGLKMPSTAEEFMPISTGLYFLEGLSMLAVDKFPQAKKPAGFFNLAGSAAYLYAGATNDSAALLLGVGIPPLLTGLAMMFENTVNNAAHKVSHWPGILGGAAGVFAKYPTATTAMIQNIAPAFLAAFSDKAANPLILPYAIAWGVANCALALTDDNLKADIDRIRAAKPAPQSSVFVFAGEKRVADWNIPSAVLSPPVLHKKRHDIPIMPYSVPQNMAFNFAA